MNRQAVPRILTTIAVVTMVVAAVGFIAGVLLDVFVFDTHDVYDAHDEVPILPLAFGVTFGLAVVILVVARVWAARARRTGVPDRRSPSIAGTAPASEWPVGDYPPEPPTLPSLATRQRAAQASVKVPTPQQAAPTLPNLPTQQQAAPTLPNLPTQQAAPLPPSTDGVREQTLKTLARLRDSGVLTEDEYEAERTRVVEGR
jgi:Short C-terminal domain